MSFKKYALLIVLIAAITLLSYQWSASLGLTGVAMLYLLCVVGVAYHYSKAHTLMVAFASFLLLNYFFVAPTFTFQVSHVASWASLISFLIVSVVITSLVKRLKVETLQSQQAYLQAEFLRKLAEKLSFPASMQALLADSQALLQQELACPVIIVKQGETIPQHCPLTAEHQHAIAWVQANGKAFGMGTHNWAEAEFVILPFNRLQSHDPVLLIPHISALAHPRLLAHIKLALVHIAVAYQHLLQKEKAQAAETQAREEVMRNTLLASIAHDMRTPLTSILGAATTLNQPGMSCSAHQWQHLTSIIASQAKHLARTTENILSLVRLESVSKDAISMEVQSPEEMLGTLANLYQHQTDAPALSIKVAQADLLIKANHDLVVLALANLVENAKQANAANQCADAAIQVSVSETEGKVVIKVCDSGAGFADGFNVQDIQKFKSSRPKGFGLGLSIVDAVAKLHQAALIFEKNSQPSASAEKGNKQGASAEKASQQGACVSLMFSKAHFALDDVS